MVVMGLLAVDVAAVEELFDCRDDWQPINSEQLRRLNVIIDLMGS